MTREQALQVLSAPGTHKTGAPAKAGKNALFAKKAKAQDKSDVSASKDDEAMIASGKLNSQFLLQACPASQLLLFQQKHNSQT